MSLHSADRRFIGASSQRKAIKGETVCVWRKMKPKRLDRRPGGGLKYSLRTLPPPPPPRVGPQPNWKLLSFVFRLRLNLFDAVKEKQKKGQDVAMGRDILAQFCRPSLSRSTVCIRDAPIVAQEYNWHWLDVNDYISALVILFYFLLPLIVVLSFHIEAPLILTVSHRSACSAFTKTDSLCVWNALDSIC